MGGGQIKEDKVLRKRKQPLQTGIIFVAVTHGQLRGFAELYPAWSSSLATAGATVCLHPEPDWQREPRSPPITCPCPERTRAHAVSSIVGERGDAGPRIWVSADCGDKMNSPHPKFIFEIFFLCGLGSACMLLPEIYNIPMMGDCSFEGWERKCHYWVPRVLGSYRTVSHPCNVIQALLSPLYRPEIWCSQVVFLVLVPMVVAGLVFEPRSLKPRSFYHCPPLEGRPWNGCQRYSFSVKQTGNLLEAICAKVSKEGSSQSWLEPAGTLPMLAHAGWPAVIARS